MSKSDHEEPRLEAHRAIARELHLSAQRAYTFGGGSALLAVGALLLLAIWMGQATTPLPYVASVMVFFVTLFFARRAIHAHLDRLVARLQGYCQSNDIEFDALIRYFAARDYTMLEALLARAAQNKGK